MSFDQLKDRIRNDKAHIVVMGLGYVGLPLAAEFARAGFQVTGFDPNHERVQMINRGISHVEYPSSELLRYLVGTKTLWASADPQVLASADVVFICVPTPLSRTREPDLSMVEQAVKMIVTHQHPGMLVVLESTSYPGTTQEFLVPPLTRDDFRLGQEVFIGYSPERIDPGNSKYFLTNTPKVVSGVTQSCSQLTQLVYSKINEQTVLVSSPEVAEMSKILENTFRQVNIGLANEIALMCQTLDIDAFEVIDAAATKPYGFMPFYPGLGVGGHCIKPDPLYLAWKLRALEGQSRFIDLADSINSHMPDHSIKIITETLNEQSQSVKGSRVLILGVTYKPDVADVRESPVLTLMEKLYRLGAEVEYEDPLVPTIQTEHWSAEAVKVDHYGTYDLVVVASPHRSFDLIRVLREAQTIVDTRAAIRGPGGRPVSHPKVRRI